MPARSSPAAPPASPVTPTNAAVGQPNPDTAAPFPMAARRALGRLQGHLAPRWGAELVHDPEAGDVVFVAPDGDQAHLAVQLTADSFTAIITEFPRGDVAAAHAVTCATSHEAQAALAVHAAAPRSGIAREVPQSVRRAVAKFAISALPSPRVVGKAAVVGGQLQQAMAVHGGTR